MTAMAATKTPRKGTVLVTGGAGFIGSHVVDRLLEKKRRVRRVVCVDNFDPFYDPAIKEGNIRQAKKDRRFHCVETDICDRRALEDVFRKVRPQVVIHLAARAGVRPSLANPDAYYQTNVEGTLNVLECARDVGTQRVVFGSSSSVYGVSSRLPFSEQDPLSCPISPYAVSKMAAESICRIFHNLYGLSIVCLRFFTVYGPRQRPEMAIAKFARHILAGKTIDLYGDGSSRRDYTYVDDIVDGVLASIKKPKKFDIINLGDARAVTLMDLIHVLESWTKKKAAIHWMESQPGDVPVTYASVAKARRLLGYRPKVSIREGIRRYLEWLQSAAQ